MLFVNSGREFVKITVLENLTWTPLFDTTAGKPGPWLPGFCSTGLSCQFLVLSHPWGSLDVATESRSKCSKVFEYSVVQAGFLKR